MSDSAYNLSIPVKLDAFVLNRDIADPIPDGSKFNARIATLGQPNYALLRFEDCVLQSDILPPVDIHNSQPSAHNSRVTDLGDGGTRECRLGIYLHWILPRPYRSSPSIPPSSSSCKPNKTRRTGSRNNPLDGDDGSTVPAPTYPNPPTRWLIIRKLDPNAPTTLPARTSIPPVQAWVVESDFFQTIDQIMDPTIDLQVDVTPFVNSSAKAGSDPVNVSVDQQGEIFIGRKSAAEGWSEPGTPGVGLSLLNSSNQLFADYQPHNGNVFSILDKFVYGADDAGNDLCLTDCVADYYVLGWHGDPKDDPFGPSYLTGAPNSISRGENLSNWSMQLQNSANQPDWIGSTLSTSVICHGAMYGVEWHDRWNTNQPQRPAKTPGDDFSDYLRKSMPVSVGTTPTDALLAYVATHHEEELENDIWQLGALLRSQNESVAGLQAGADEVQNYNFSNLAGGTHYVLSIEDGKPLQQPSSDNVKLLRELNEAQYLADCAARSLRQAQWDTFAVWWEFCTDIDNNLNDTHPHDGDYSSRVQALKGARKTLEAILSEQQDTIDAKTKALKAAGLVPKSITLQGFSQQKDPTIFIEGTKSGWPDDFLKPLLVRIDTQVSTWNPSQPSVDRSYGVNCVPDLLQPTAQALIREFLLYHPARAVVKAAPSTFAPLYHDQGDPAITSPADAPWRDRWESTQPWFPLFVEWEINYFHVPYLGGDESNDWTISQTTTRLQSQKKFRYGIKDDVVLYDKPLENMDKRTLSGRILILPQPSYSLSGQIDQLFSSVPADILDGLLSPDERKKLQVGVKTLPFLSAPLDGLVNHLATTLQGSHLKPNVRIPTKDPITITAAYEQSGSDRVKLDATELGAIGMESNLTPYGSEVQFPSDQQTDHSPFKPVTHGQFQFTKINIVDKFGQVAAALDPSPIPPGQLPPPFYPCISDYYEPEMTAEGLANTITKPASDAVCGFAQVPPQINQPARLNMTFVVKDDFPPVSSDLEGQSNILPVYWRPVTEWENPIWGWLVVNYVDNGLQFFTQDGQFYREVRVAAENNPLKTSLLPKWLPFDPSSQSGSQTQLDNLIGKLHDPNNPKEAQAYLEAFMKMVTTAAGDSTAPPSAYSQFVQSLVGKPLALVNVGVDIELASDPRKNQSTANAWKDDALGEYSLPFKLGDRDRSYDGLVGYFQAYTDPDERGAGNELCLDKLFTDYIENPLPPFYHIDTDTFSTVTPPWTPPAAFSSTSFRGGQLSAAAAFTGQRNSQLTANVFGCILDPFQPVHAYSGILPQQALSLPAWTWQAALTNVTAFFHFGPLMLVDDVPAWDPTHRLTAGYSPLPPGGHDQTVDLKQTSPFKLPALRVANWSWLQPYVDENGKPNAFMAICLGESDSRPRYDKGPYTAIEGYLQMRAPIQEPPAK